VRFDGVITPIVTPFDADGEVDYGRLADVAEFLVGEGVDQILAGGTTGEFYALTPEERVATVKFLAERLRGRIPLIAGTAAASTREAEAFARAAREASADAIMVMSSSYALPAQGEDAAHALRVREAAGLPAMLYNFPARTGSDMGREYLDAVTRSPDFCAIKESSGSIDRLHLLCTGYPSLQVCCGRDDQALEYYAWGSAGWVCAGSNFVPGAHRMLHDACAVARDFVLARRIMAALLPLMEYRRTCGKFVQCIKEGMALKGVPAGDARGPLAPLDGAEKERMKEIVGAMERRLREIAADGARRPAEKAEAA